MNRDYLEGAKARARKEDYRPMASEQWKQGYEYMQGVLVGIEQEIVLATLKYQSVATNTVRELEGQFRDRGDAGDSATAAADPALPSERPAQYSEDRGDARL